ncbi:DegV family protein [Leekyejoonella antrihumi]|uniref:DegV family protein n=1 Tax=Leekyejoonella antrihumi TaxID=1660198 RepID=A0A563E5T7_9MICO|nr:DegV family protein [Leekyejoonella antrihumi]TWP37582.1 DegV family protein [Leekyejoonella antrihumi]
MAVAVVTDSTAYLPPDLAARHGIRVVPLHVVVAGTSYEESLDISAGEVADALRDFRPVSTSRPTPASFEKLYRELTDAGVDEIVSIHLSAQMSATIESAELAAGQVPVRVHVVDSRALGMTMGFAVLAAAEAAEAGAVGSDIVKLVRQSVDGGSAIFYVDTLEHLRRGGRIGKASALLGSALSIKPLLTLTDGHIEPLERVRTATKALARLEERTVAATAAMDAPDGVDVAVQHLDSLERAEQLVERLTDSIPTARRILLVELGAVVGAHVGPGTLAVSVNPRGAGRMPIVGAAT